MRLCCVNAEALTLAAWKKAQPQRIKNVPAPGRSTSFAKVGSPNRWTCWPGPTVTRLRDDARTPLLSGPGRNRKSGACWRANANRDGTIKREGNKIRACLVSGAHGSEWRAGQDRPVHGAKPFMVAATKEGPAEWWRSAVARLLDLPKNERKGGCVMKDRSVHLLCNRYSVWRSEKKYCAYTETIRGRGITKARQSCRRFEFFYVSRCIVFRIERRRYF